MKKFIIPIFVMLSLLFAQVAYSGVIDVQNDIKCHSEGKSDNKADGKTKDSDKFSKSLHHCCGSHVSFRNDSISYNFTLKSSDVINSSYEFSMTSIVVDPSVEPPSHV